MGTPISPRIAAAAIRHDGRVYSLPPPARHHDIIAYLVDTLGFPAPIPADSQQGFVTDNRGRFVDRYMARDCAIANGQLLPRAGNTAELFSEDVW